MKTVKEVSQITGVSIRTLRYYDEIGLLKPAELTEAGYRLYDSRALGKLEEIRFFRELEIPLAVIKVILDNPDCDREKALAAQRALLVQERNRLNGIIELIDDVKGGVNDMKFEAFTDEEIEKIIDHSLSLQSRESLELMAKQYGSMEALRENMAEGLRDEKWYVHAIKMYGGKEKAVEALLQTESAGEEKLGEWKRTFDEIYRQFAAARETKSETAAMDAVEKLGEMYKRMLRVDNARYLLLDLARHHSERTYPEVLESVDQKYGEGVSEYMGEAIRQYYGIS